jgi:nucleoside-diphosphate-sugar epimerase
MPQKLGLLTGFPGWLTNRFLQRLDSADDPYWQDSLRDYRWHAIVAPENEDGYGALTDKVAQIHVADVRDEGAVARAFTINPDLVLHAAGIIHPSRICQLYEINRDGTRNVAEAATKSEVRRLVYISSNAAAGFGCSATDRMCESDAPNPQSQYGKSKLEGERVVWRTIEGSATEAVVLRPATVYGPRFPRRQLRAFLTVRDGRPPIFGDGENAVSAVYIDNLVQCVGLALTVPEGAGKTYFVADDPVYRWREVFDEIGRAQGVAVRPRRFPALVATACAFLDGFLARLDQYAMDVHLAGEADRHMGCSIDRAKTELGYRPITDLSRGMVEAVQWAKQSAWL